MPQLILTLLFGAGIFFQSISFLGFKLSRDARLNLGICAAGAVLLALVIWSRGRGGL
jgi:hypothetical protein